MCATLQVQAQIEQEQQDAAMLRQRREMQRQIEAVGTWGNRRFLLAESMGKVWKNHGKILGK